MPPENRVSRGAVLLASEGGIAGPKFSSADQRPHFIIKPPRIETERCREGELTAALKDGDGPRDGGPGEAGAIR